MSGPAAEPDAPRDTGAVDREHPWPGLAAFREKDREFFFGRGDEVEELHRLVVRQRSTVLFGLSGLGKTSLLRAGLFPRVRPEGLLPVYLRLDHADASRPLASQVKEEIARAAAQAGVEAPGWRESDTLWEIFHRHESDFWNPRNRPVTPLLVFDQFEEIFTVGRRSPEQTARSAEFLEELGDLIEGRPPAAVRSRLEDSPGEALEFAFSRHGYKVLIGLREDFVVELEDLVARVPSLLQNRMRLQRMDGKQAMDVVHGAGGALVAGDVAERIVRFVGSAGSDEQENGSGPRVARARAEGRQRPLRDLRVEPALLSVICRELNNRRLERHNATITADLLEGSRAEILAGFYERSFEGLPGSVREFVEERLLTVSGFRDSVALENVLADPRVPREAIDRLVDRRLVRIDERSGAERIELTHDVLASVVRESRDAARTERELHTARERAEGEREQAIERERETRAQLQRARRQRTALLVVVAVVVLALVRAYLGERRAQTSAASEKRTRSTAAAYYQLEANIRRPFVEQRADEALAYLAAATRFDPENAALRSMLLDFILHVSRPQPPSIMKDESAAVPEPGMHLPFAVLAVTFSADGERVITVSEDTARVWDGRSGDLIGQPTKRQSEQSRSPRDGEEAATGHDPGICASGWCRPVAPVFALSRDGSRVFTISDNTPRVLDLHSGASIELRLNSNDTVPVFPGEQWVFAAAFSPDGERLVTGSPDAVARLWDARTGASIGEPMIQHLSGRAPRWHRRTVVAVAFSPDGERVVTGNEGRAPARLWDARSGAPIGQPMIHRATVRHVAFSSDGQLLITGSDDSTARLWDGRSGAPIGEPMKHEDWVTAVTFSPDGERVVTASADHTARLWDARSATPVGEPMKHEDWVTAVAFSPDGELVVTASGDKTARLWDGHSGASIGHSMKHGVAVRAVAFSPGGKRIVTGSLARTPQLWDGHTGAPIGPPMRSGDPALASRDGQRAVTTSPDPFAPDETARLWNSRFVPPLAVAMRHEGRVVSVTSSPDGDRVLTTASDNLALLWDERSGAPIGEPMRHGASVTTAAFSPDGERVVTASKDNTARLWNGRSGAPIGQPMKHSRAVRAVAFSPNGERIITGSLDRTAHLWDGNTGAPLGQPMSHASRVLAVAFKSDGERVVTVSVSGRDPWGHRGHVARLWDARSGIPASKPVNFAGGEPRTIAFSPDGDRGVTAAWAPGAPGYSFPPGAPKYAVLWGYSNTFRHEHPGNSFISPSHTLLHDGVVKAVAFSPDGTRVVSASADHTARLWDADTGVPIGSAMQHDAGVRAVAFSADGARVVTGSSDHTARVWDGRTGAPLGGPMKHDATVVAVAFSADGESVVTGSEHTTRVWAAPAGTKEDAEHLAMLAETLGGLTLSRYDALLPIRSSREYAERLEHPDGMQATRAWLADPAGPETSGRAAVRWLLSDPWARTISPTSTVTVPDYIKSRLAEGTPEARADMERHFPGHPLLQEAPSLSR